MKRQTRSNEECTETGSLTRSAWTSPRETPDAGISRKVPRISMGGSLFRIPKVENIKQLSQALRERRTFWEVGEGADSSGLEDERHQSTNCPATHADNESQLLSPDDFQAKRRARRESVRNKILQRRQERQQGCSFASTPNSELQIQNTNESQTTSYADLTGRLQRTVQQLTLQANRIRTLEGQLFADSHQSPANSDGCRSARSTASASPNLQEKPTRKASSPDLSRPSSVGDAPTQRNSSRESARSSDHDSSFLSRLKRTIHSRESVSEDPSKPQSAQAHKKGSLSHPDASLDDTSSSSQPTNTPRLLTDTKPLGSSTEQGRNYGKSKAPGGLLRKLKYPTNGKE
eukprot:gb/GECG01013448.1/.p1 GENE.gb/GECG01013448.1/~~gb/GECG01013448.1/.p1  ORF type:complete len:346 (+),score=38.56 gb/GECG01013448.1/:1-1038(+)